MEFPLLRAIHRHGGSILFSLEGSTIAEELADYFRLTPEQRRYSSPEINSLGHNYWRNTIQYVRLKLVKKGYLDNSTRDLWALTDAGRRLVESDAQWQAEKRDKELAQTITDDCDVLFSGDGNLGYATPDRSSTYYERDPRLRKEAISFHGTSCKVCGFNFGDFFGEEKGKDYIEVHHIVPISDAPETRETDPRRDLIPVCANCHRMIHRRRKRTLHPDELKAAIVPAEEEYGIPRNETATDRK